MRLRCSPRLLLVGLAASFFLSPSPGLARPAEPVAAARAPGASLGPPPTVQLRRAPPKGTLGRQLKAARLKAGRRLEATLEAHETEERLVHYGSLAVTLGSELAHLGWLGPAGSLVHLTTSGHALSTAANLEERLSSGAHVSLAGAALLHGLSHGGVVASLADGLGVFGAVCHTAGGCLLLADGLRHGRLEKIRLGAIDLAGGLVWLAAALLAEAHPLLFAGHATLLFGRAAFAHRHQLLRHGSRLRDRALCLLDSCRVWVTAGADRLEQRVREVVKPLRRLSQGLTAASQPAAPGAAAPAP